MWLLLSCFFHKLQEEAMSDPSSFEKDSLHHLCHRLVLRNLRVGIPCWQGVRVWSIKMAPWRGCKGAHGEWQLLAIWGWPPKLHWHGICNARSLIGTLSHLLLDLRETNVVVNQLVHVASNRTCFFSAVHIANLSWESHKFDNSSGELVFFEPQIMTSRSISARPYRF